MVRAHIKKKFTSHSTGGVEQSIVDNDNTHWVSESHKKEVNVHYLHFNLALLGTQIFLISDFQTRVLQYFSKN